MQASLRPATSAATRAASEGGNEAHGTVIILPLLLAMSMLGKSLIKRL